MKTALVLGGGGSRGAYEVGVWKALRELNIPFSIVTGTSVGALNGAMIAQGDFDAAETIWSNITNDMILDLEKPLGTETLRERLERLGVLAKEIVVSHGINPAPLKKMLDDLLDEERIRQSAIQFGMVTVRLSDMKPKELFVQDIPNGKLTDYIMASASCFPAMQSHTIDGEAYIDGGYADTIPIALALKGGADSIIAVDINGIGIKKMPTGLPKENLRCISSPWSLGSFLNFEAEAARRNMTLGYLDTLKSYGKLCGHYYAFTPDAQDGLRSSADWAQRLFTEQFPVYASLANYALQRRQLYTLGRIAGSGQKGHKATEHELRQAFWENAARIFALDPTSIYSADSFREALLQTADKQDFPEADRLEGILTARDTPAEKTERLLAEARRLNPAGIAKWILTGMSDTALSGLSASVLPNPFLAALAVRALQ